MEVLYISLLDSVCFQEVSEIFDFKSFLDSVLLHYRVFQELGIFYSKVRWIRSYLFYRVIYQIT